MKLTPGCVKRQSGHYLPIIFQAHGKVFFSANSFDTADDAISYAAKTIEDGTHIYWHSHAISKE